MQNVRMLDYKVLWFSILAVEKKKKKIKKFTDFCEILNMNSKILICTFTYLLCFPKGTSTLCREAQRGEAARQKLISMGSKNAVHACVSTP